MSESRGSFYLDRGEFSITEFNYLSGAEKYRGLLRDSLEGKSLEIFVADKFVLQNAFPQFSVWEASSKNQLANVSAKELLRIVQNGRLETWDLLDKSSGGSFPFSFKGTPTCVRIVDDGKNAIVASAEGLVAVVALDSGEMLEKYKLSSGIEGLSCSADSRYIAASRIGKNPLEGFGFLSSNRLTDWLYRVLQPIPENAIIDRNTRAIHCGFSAPHVSLAGQQVPRSILLPRFLKKEPRVMIGTPDGLRYFDLPPTSTWTSILPWLALLAAATIFVTVLRRNRIRKQQQLSTKGNIHADHLLGTRPNPRDDQVAGETAPLAE